VAPELGLVEQTLRNWVAPGRSRCGDAKELTVSERTKFKQPEKEVSAGEPLARCQYAGLDRQYPHIQTP